jgi:hypothetical protein
MGMIREPGREKGGGRGKKKGKKIIHPYRREDG